MSLCALLLCLEVSVGPSLEESDQIIPRLPLNAPSRPHHVERRVSLAFKDAPLLGAGVRLV